MNGRSTAQHINDATVLARALYQRTRKIAAFDDATDEVSQMLASLRELHAEARNPSSVLNNSNRDESASGVYERQLQPIVEDSEFALKQLETVLTRYDNATGAGAAGPVEVDAALADRIASVTAKIAREESNIAFFLDTVRLGPKSPHNHSATMPDVAELDDEIKHEMDSMATRLFSRHTGALENDSESLWLETKAELERRDFTSAELETDKVAIKVYLNQLVSCWNRNCGATPTYQSVAEFEANTAPQVQHPASPPVVPPKVPILPSKETTQPQGNEKPSPSIKERRFSDELFATVLPSQYSFNAPLGTEDQGTTELSMALISTKELVDLDSLNWGMAVMNLNTGSPQSQSSRLASSTAADDYARPPNSLALSTSPRNHSSNHADAAQPQYTNTNPSRPPRLAPDAFGREIPADATWTKVRRTLISSEVLDKARVRYEARPEYVAILGRLSRDDIAKFARESAECRAARSRPPLPARRANANGYAGERRYNNSTSKSHDSDDDSLSDESDSTDYEARPSPSDKKTRSYPIIVNAPSKPSPSTTVKPKPILKKKTTNHVRFDPQPHEVGHPSSAPSGYGHSHDRRRDYGPGEGSSSSRRHRDHSDRDHDRDERSNRSGHHRDKRDRPKKKSWGDTLGAVGIGSAALLLGGVGGF